MIDFEQINKYKQLLFSAVIADILDDLGIKNSALDTRIRPVNSNMKIIGRAFTILATEIYEPPNKPYEIELEAIDSLSKGDVVVAKINGRESNCGFWGELLTTVALNRGCFGAIIDGATRDSNRIAQMKFPIFVKGYSPYDSKGRVEVIGYQVPVRSGDTNIYPGDIIFADIDGIVCIPQKIQSEVFSKALEKINSENIVKKELAKGASLKEVYNKYHIL